ncbi:MICOS complex subunit MIC60-like isoform X2 [Corticium candelabrum]|uniref:MICOS complex subunit MIC60-like isoform X2 n=1 Tax=Corticium candelabrum TaxID=121492 RepID=UPI002E26DC92|nr:MICOS complex subunit MIC60-like isoform X2 [Corticium candelabrum]
MWRFGTGSRASFLRLRLPSHRCEAIRQAGSSSHKSALGGWVPVVAVGGGAIGVIIGTFTLAAVKPSFSEFLEKQFPALKSVLRTIQEQTGRYSIGSASENAGGKEMRQEDTPVKRSKVTGFKVVQPAATVQHQGNQTPPDGLAGDIIEEIDSTATEHQNSQEVQADKVANTVEGVAIETEQANGSTLSLTEKPEQWLDDVSDTLKGVCVQVANEAVSQQHMLCDNIKEMTEIIRLFLSDAVGVDNKQRDRDMKLMEIQSKVEVAMKGAVDAFQLFEKSVSDLHRHLDMLSNAKKQEESLTISELIAKLKYDVEKSQIEVTEAQADLALNQDYLMSVETSRRKLESELAELTPATEVDVPTLLQYADKRLEKLRQELEEHKRIVHEQVTAAVQRQKRVDAEVAESQLQAKINLIKSEHKSDIERVMNQVQQDYLVNMQERLHHQASVYHEHIDSILNAQKEKLEKQFHTQLRLERQHECAKQQAALDVTVAKLHGVESVINDVVEVDKAQCNSKEFYRACQLFLEALDRKNGEHSKPLQSEVDRFRSLENAALSHPIIQTTLESIPQKALQNGIPLEDALHWRFAAMKKACQRVALIGEDGGNVFQYLLSYLHSFFRVETRINVNEDSFCPEDGTDTFHLLSLAEHFVRHGNLELAARLVNQLQGEPHRLAADWLSDVRLLLETKQAVSVLCSYASLSEL